MFTVWKAAQNRRKLEKNTGGLKVPKMAKKTERNIGLFHFITIFDRLCILIQYIVIYNTKRSKLAKLFIFGKRKILDLYLI